MRESNCLKIHTNSKYTQHLQCLSGLDSHNRSQIQVQYIQVIFAIPGPCSFCSLVGLVGWSVVAPVIVYFIL